MMNKRNEYFIREGIIKCYNDLDSLDINKYTKTQLRSIYSKINKELKNLFKEYGRVVPQAEARSWLVKNISLTEKR